MWATCTCGWGGDALAQLQELRKGRAVGRRNEERSQVVVLYDPRELHACTQEFTQVTA